MPAKFANIDTRIGILSKIVDSKHQKKVSYALKEAKGDWATAADILKKDKLPVKTLKRLEVADLLATAAGDEPATTKLMAKLSDINDINELARLNVRDLMDLIGTEMTANQAKKQATEIYKQSFIRRPLVVLQTISERELALNDKVRAGLISILKRIPEESDIRSQPFHKFLTEDALTEVTEEHRAEVISYAKSLWRTMAITPADTPQVPAVLLNAKLTSAFLVAEMPESAFVKTFAESMDGEDVARRVHNNAMSIRIHNENMLMNILDSVRGTGLSFIDGTHNIQTGLQVLKEIATKNDVQLNWDSLFKDMDYFDYDEYGTVYSPASYFVDLLNYLRNNNFDKDNSYTYQKGIAETPLESLLQRRPDLGNLELTPENTKTLIPYIDLVNEIMESYVVHRSDWAINKPKLDAFNVDDETSDELLAQPQHTNYMAYCILKNEARYPFTLPFHQPIEAARIYLHYLGTSRYEVMDKFRAAHEVIVDDDYNNIEDTCKSANKLPSPYKLSTRLNKIASINKTDEIDSLHNEVLNRAVDAEYLGLTQEEYIIIAREAFWNKEYFEYTHNKTYSVAEYRKNIGVKKTFTYFGYNTEDSMLSENITSKSSICLVKNQFLPRTGIKYTDLMELLKTRFINPNYPDGKALAMLESIRFSYRFLSTLVDTSTTDPQVRYAQLVDFLESNQALISLAELSEKFPTHKHRNSYIRQWVYQYFEKIGKLIVLEYGAAPKLPVYGSIINPKYKSLTLNTDGTVVNSENQIIGRVSMVVGKYKEKAVYDNNGKRYGLVSDSDYSRFKDDMTVVIAGPLVLSNGKSIYEEFGCNRLTIRNQNEIIWLSSDRALWRNEYVVFWQAAEAICDLDSVELQHLDGTSLTIDENAETGDEYGRIHRFIRLWHKLGWTIDEVDKTLQGLGRDSHKLIKPVKPSVPHFGFNVLQDTCNANPCPASSIFNLTQEPAATDITSHFLHQLAAVKKLLEITGLPVIKLLCFWADMSTAGKTSLYSKLFLTHNMIGIDNVFKADDSGQYLTGSEKISDHLPVLMAALKLKADDIISIVGADALLTLANVSEIYRNSLLARAMNIRVSDMKYLKTVFGDPFTDAITTLDLFKTWEKMEDAGFNFRQLSYIIKNLDDPMKPLAFLDKSMLQIAKTLYDGLTAIEKDNPDLNDKDADKATIELIQTKAGLLMEPKMIEKLVGLLEGTNVYTVGAPADLNIVIPDELIGKINYLNRTDLDPHQASLKVTGILDMDNQNALKSLVDRTDSKYSDWEKAIARIGNQIENLYDEILADILPADAKLDILAADIKDKSDPGNNTAPKKRFTFLQHFLVFLRKELMYRFVATTISGTLSLSRDVTKVLLTYSPVSQDISESAESVLIKIKDAPTDASPVWYLIPPQDGDYRFSLPSQDSNLTTPLKSINIDDKKVEFSNIQLDPAYFVFTNLVPLKKGQLYKLAFNENQSPDNLQWKITGTLWTPIPTSALLPDHINSTSNNHIRDIFSILNKAAIAASGFGLSSDEILHFQQYSEDKIDGYDGFDIFNITLAGWLRIADYVILRKKFPRAGMALLDLFKWSRQAVDIPDETLLEQINQVTQWGKDRIKDMIAEDHFDLNKPKFFKNEKYLFKMTRAFEVADKVGIDINHLFYWALPGSKFWPCHYIAEDIRMAIQARFDADDFEQAIKPLSDQLRNMQKEALISFLLIQPALRKWSVVDADSLFEFFLIDVQMGSEKQTSRMVQAISSVQLFIKRCFLGLEPINFDLDRNRWEWMQCYRLWEANRKVFLYPENWIRPELRDDKSSFYKELESELLQKDINAQNIQEALKNYLYKVDEVSNLKVVGLYAEPKDKEQDSSKRIYTSASSYYKKLHVFARTRNTPYFFYYRYFDISTREWYPWEKMQADIPSYDVDDVGTHQSKGNGIYLIPVVWNNRLLVFFPQFSKKTMPNPSINDKSAEVMGANKTSESQPISYWEIKMAWIEYRNGKWTQKQLSPDAVYDLITTTGNDPVITTYQCMPDISAYVFVPVISENGVSIEIQYMGELQQVFNPQVSNPQTEPAKLQSVELLLLTTTDNKDNNICFNVTVKDKDNNDIATLENYNGGTYDDRSLVRIADAFEIKQRNKTLNSCKGFTVNICDVSDTNNGWNFHAFFRLVFDQGQSLVAKTTNQVTLNGLNQNFTISHNIYQDSPQSEQSKLQSVELAIFTTDDDKDAGFIFNAIVLDTSGNEIAAIKNYDGGKFDNNTLTIIHNDFDISQKDKSLKDCNGFKVSITGRDSRAWVFYAIVRLIFDQGESLVAYTKDEVTFKENKDNQIVFN